MQKKQKRLFLRIRVPFQTKYMSIKTSKISVIIPIYNDALYIQEAVRRIAVLKETLVRK